MTMPTYKQLVEEGYTDKEILRAWVRSGGSNDDFIAWFRGEEQEPTLTGQMVDAVKSVQTPSQSMNTANARDRAGVKQALHAIPQSSRAHFLSRVDDMAEKQAWRKGDEQIGPPLKPLIDGKWHVVWSNEPEPFTLRAVKEDIVDISNDVSAIIGAAGYGTYHLGVGLFSDKYGIDSEYLGEKFPFAKPLMDALWTDTVAALSFHGIGDSKTRELFEPIEKEVKEEIGYQYDLLGYKGFWRYAWDVFAKHPVTAVTTLWPMFKGFRMILNGTWDFTADGIKAIADTHSELYKVVDKISDRTREPLHKKVVEIKKKEGEVEVEREVEVQKIPREYSDDVFVRNLIQRPFDIVADKYPGLTEWLYDAGGEKVLKELRDSAMAMADAEAFKMTDEFLDALNKLKKADPYAHEHIVPILEMRMSMLNPSSELKDFVDYYKQLQKKIETHFIEQDIVKVKDTQSRAVRALSQAVGKSEKEVLEDLGGVLPAYVPNINPSKSGTRYDPGKHAELKKRYTDDLAVLMPRLIGNYKTSQNVRKYIKTIQDDLGVQVNARHISRDADNNIVVTTPIVKDGKIISNKTKTYIGYEIIDDTVYMKHFEQERKIVEGIREKSIDMTFDEALIATLDEMTAVLEVQKVAVNTAKTRLRDALIKTMKGDEARDFEAVALIEAINKGSLDKDALREYLIKINWSAQSINKLFKGVIKDLDVASGNRAVHIVPKKVADQVRQLSTPDSNASNVGVVFDSVNSLFKKDVLGTSPVWAVHNIGSDIWLLGMQGTKPKFIPRAFQKEYKDIIPQNVLDASFAKVALEGGTEGLETWLGKAMKDFADSKVGRGLNYVPELGYKINSMLENPFVRIKYLDLAERQLKKMGLKPTIENLKKLKGDAKAQMAIHKELKESLPVFNLSGAWERKYLGRAIPFYNWFKFMAIHATKLPLNHPFRFAGMRGLGALSEKQREDIFIETYPFMKRDIEENGVPDIFDHLWPLGDDKFFNARGFNIYSTVTDVVTANLYNLVGNMSPVIKFNVEELFGVSTFKGKEIEEGAHKPSTLDHLLKTMLPSKSRLLQKLVTPFREYDTGKIWEPDVIYDQKTGQAKFPISTVETMLNFIGVKTKTLDTDEMWMKHVIRNMKKEEKKFWKKYEHQDHITLEQFVDFVIDYMGEGLTEEQVEQWAELVEKQEEEEYKKIKEAE